MRILLIEDDPKLSAVIADGFAEQQTLGGCWPRLSCATFRTTALRPCPGPRRNERALSRVPRVAQFVPPTRRVLAAPPPPSPQLP